MRILKQATGFSIIELMVVLALFAILAATTTPSVKSWLRTYKTKGAARDLYSYLQTAKIGATKENRQWKVVFNPSGSYEVIKCLTSTCEAGVLNTDYEISKTMSFSTDYKDDIKFKNPASSIVFDSNPLVFNPNGLTNQGYVYLSDRDDTRFYRVGLPSFAGAIVMQKWTGSGWD